MKGLFGIGGRGRSKRGGVSCGGLVAIGHWLLFAQPADRGTTSLGQSSSKQLLAGWIASARRSRLHEFVALARTIKRFQQLIWNTLHKHGVSNARSEATNTHIRALTKRACGYHSPEALIVKAILTRGGLKLELRGRK